MLRLASRRQKEDAAKESMSCQNCLEKNHWTFECRSEAVHLVRNTGEHQVNYNTNEEEIPKDPVSHLSRVGRHCFVYPGDRIHERINTKGNKRSRRGYHVPEAESHSLGNTDDAVNEKKKKDRLASASREYRRPIHRRIVRSLAPSRSTGRTRKNDEEKNQQT